MKDWAAIDWKLIQRERKTEEWVRAKDADDIVKAIIELEDAVEELQEARAELETGKYCQRRARSRGEQP
jgi:hypothetical protein